MDEYTPNSHKFKESQQSPPPEKKKVEKVVTGVVKTKKSGIGSKLASMFISEDVKDVKSYLLTDILIPSIKNTIYDMVTGGLDRALFNGYGRGRKSSVAGNVSYRSFYDKQSANRYSSTEPPRTRTGYNYDDIILETRSEAEDVLARMDELVETYGAVSVADLYDLVGKTGDYTNNKYGWTNIKNAEAIRVRDGYMLKLPKVTPIDN